MNKLAPQTVVYRGTVTNLRISTVDGGATASGGAFVDALPTAALARASAGMIWMTGIAVANETFVIDTQTFTWKASRSGAGEVTIGATAVAARENLRVAILADLATVVPDASAPSVNLLITAATAGTAGNSIVFTENSTNMVINGSGYLNGTTVGANFVDGTHSIEIYDSAGRFLRGVLKAVGTGEGLGSELVDGWTNYGAYPFETFTPGAGLDITQAVNTVGYGMAYKVVTQDIGWLTKIVATINIASGAWHAAGGFGPYYGASTPIYTVKTTTTGTYGTINQVVDKVGCWQVDAIDFSLSGFSYKQVLTPSTSGVTIVSAKGGVTYNFGYKDASFTYNAASYTVIVKKLRGRSLNVSTTGTGPRISAVDDTAFIDNLPAGVVSTLMDGKHYLRIWDPNGKYIEGIMKAVGTGETVGSALNSNPTFDANITGWSGSEATIASSFPAGGGQSNDYLILTATSGISQLAKTSSAITVQANSLNKMLAYVKSGSSGNEAYNISINSSVSGDLIKTVSGTSSASWVLNSIYYTAVETNLQIRLNKDTGTLATMFFDEVSLCKVLTPSTSGATIVNTISGTDYHWITKESGFDYNNTGTYTFQVWSEN